MGEMMTERGRIPQPEESSSWRLCSLYKHYIINPACMYHGAGTFVVSWLSSHEPFWLQNPVPLLNSGIWRPVPEEKLDWGDWKMSHRSGPLWDSESHRWDKDQSSGWLIPFFLLALTYPVSSFMMPLSWWRKLTLWEELNWGSSEQSVVRTVLVPILVISV